METIKFLKEADLDFSRHNHRSKIVTISTLIVVKTKLLGLNQRTAPPYSKKFKLTREVSKQNMFLLKCKHVHKRKYNNANQQLQRN